MGRSYRAVGTAALASPSLVQVGKRDYTNGGLDRTLGREALRWKEVTDACRCASSSSCQSNSRIRGWIHHLGTGNVVLSSFSHIGMTPVPHGLPGQWCA